MKPQIKSIEMTLFASDGKDNEHNKHIGTLLKTLDDNLGRFIESKMTVQNIGTENKSYVAAVKWNENAPFSAEDLNSFLQKASHGAFGISADNTSADRSGIKLSEGNYPLTVDKDILSGKKPASEIIFNPKQKSIDALGHLKEGYVGKLDQRIEKLQEGASYTHDLRVLEQKNKAWKIIDKLEEWHCKMGGKPSTAADELLGKISSVSLAK